MSVGLDPDTERKKDARARRNPMSHPRVAQALKEDLSRMGMTKTDFAKALGMKLQTIGWWFSGAMVPMLQMIKVVNVLGIHSKTAEALRETARETLNADALADASRKRVVDILRQMDGLQELHHFMNAGAYKAKTITVALEDFVKKFPQFADIAEERDTIRREWLDEKAIYPEQMDRMTPDNLVLAQQKMNIGNPSASTMRVCSYPNNEMNELMESVRVWAMVNDDGGTIQDGLAHQLSSTLRPFISVISHAQIIATYALQWVTKDPEADPMSYAAKKLPYVTGIRAAAFELKQAAKQMNDEHGETMGLLLVIYDRWELLKKFEFHEAHSKDEPTPISDLFQDVRAMNILPVYATSLDHLHDDIDQACVNHSEPDPSAMEMKDGWPFSNDVVDTTGDDQ